MSQLLDWQASHFAIHHIDQNPEELIVMIESRSRRCRCPACHKFSRHIHSKYQRYIQDLSCFALKTKIHLTVHKFYCRNPRCPQKIFTERITNNIAPYQRRTNRLTELLTSFVLQLSGRTAEQLCSLLHIEVSDTTLGRLLFRQPLGEPTTPKVLGVDDWALKKRNCYGTILVDLERHKIIDLLKDRETASLQQWLELHPGVQVVSRDRYTNYANAVNEALPEGIQVVDRWHLLKNLCEDLKKLIERNHQHLKYARKKEIRRLQKQRSSKWHRKQKEETSKSTKNYCRRWQQFRQIKRLHKKGIPILQIAHRLGMSRNTVKKYLHLQEPPFRKSTLQVNIAMFDAYIRQRIQAEPKIERMQLYREIKEMGYDGARSTAYEYFHRYIKTAPRPKSVPRLPDLFYVPSKIAFLFLRKQTQMNNKEQKLLRDLCSRCPEIKMAYGLTQDFTEMLEHKKGRNLKRWMRKVAACGIKELKSFSSGLMSDFIAVKNALTLPWSNGQVEGQINKLKTIKRQMYGRASFDLLRKRLLLNTS